MIAPLNRANAAVVNAPRVLPAADFPGYPSPSEITAGLETIQALGGLRFERMVERLHRLGARPLAELLFEIATATHEPGLIADRVKAFANLDPEIVRAVGADRFPAMPLTVIR